MNWVDARKEQPESNYPVIVRHGNKFGAFEYSIGIFDTATWYSYYDDNEKAGHYRPKYVTHWAKIVKPK